MTPQDFFSPVSFNDWNIPFVIKGANLNNKSQLNSTLLESLTILGCVYFFGVDCNKGDITNAWSTWVGLVVGAAIAAVVTWWVYYRQKKISEKQDELLNHIADLEENNKTMLNKILSLEEKIEAMLKK
jgi:Na+-driven multidrug efflux pump